MRRDLATEKFEWDHPGTHQKAPTAADLSKVTVCKSAYEAVEGAAAIAVVTEWEQFKTLDWQKVHASMQKPAFVFDGRNILDGAKLRELGFIVYSIGKPLDPWISSMYS